MPTMIENLTLVLACKNREDNLKFCLSSIDSCNKIPRTILIDFGSTATLEAFEKIYSWLKVIRVERETDFFHKSRALNIGIQNVTTKFTCTSDVDQVYQENFFSCVINKLQKHPKIYVACRTRALSRIPSNIISQNITDNYSVLMNLVIEENKKLYGEGPCFAIPTKWLKQVRGYDEQYVGHGAQVSDIRLRAAKVGFKRCSIEKKTSTIHLPHTKDLKTEYYLRDKYFIPNRKRFLQKKKKLDRMKRVTLKDVTVNLGRSWGQL